MSETKFTQGPWVAKQDPDGSPDDWCIGIEGGKIDQVAVCGKNDAALIAAAPDLYAAQAMGSDKNTPDFLEWIADRLVMVYGEDPNTDFVLSLYGRAKAGRAAIQKATKEPT